MFGRKSQSVKDEHGAFDSFREVMDSAAELHAAVAEVTNRRKARDTATTESLRIALITNERNAGRVVEIAGPYEDFLYGDKGWGVGIRVKALETAANIGYDTTEETVESAAIFAKHLGDKPRENFDWAERFPNHLGLNDVY